MRQLRGIRLAIALCAALAADPAAAETSPFIGQWHWNPAQSSIPPGESPPRDLTAAFARADGHLTWSVTVVTQEGLPYVETFEVPADGELYPIDGDTSAALRLTGDTLQATFKGWAGQSDSFTCTLSPDHGTMICSGVLDAGNGRTSSYVDVYDRV